MRISDWSSDVCSSDLLREAYRRNGDIAGNAIDESVAQRFVSSGHRIDRAIGIDQIANHAFFAASAALRAAIVLGRSSKSARGASLRPRSEEHTSELQSLMRISYAGFCLKKQI